ncbi:MAG: DUF6111 family protein [Dongiaceae bacterium]
MRAFLSIVLPLLAPALLYFVIVGRRNSAGEIRPVPWVWLAVAGAVLMLITLGALWLFDGANPGATYVPPHLEDGKIAPGYFTE